MGLTVPTEMFNVRLKPSVAGMIRDAARREGVSQGVLLERAVSGYLAGPQTVEADPLEPEVREVDPLAEPLRAQLSRSRGLDPAEALRAMGVTYADLGGEGQRIVDHQRSLIARASTYAEAGSDPEWAWDEAEEELGAA